MCTCVGRSRQKPRISSSSTGTCGMSSSLAPSCIDSPLTSAARPVVAAVVVALERPSGATPRPVHVFQRTVARARTELPAPPAGFNEGGWERRRAHTVSAWISAGSSKTYRHGATVGRVSHECAPRWRQAYTVREATRLQGRAGVWARCRRRRPWTLWTTVTCPITRGDPPLGDAFNTICALAV